MRRRILVATLAALATLALTPHLVPLPRWFYEAPPTSIVFLDRDGGRLGGRGAAGAAARRPVRFDEVDPLLRRATLAAEDRRFELHPGLDPIALARAVRNAIRRGRPIEGASTITTQLVRLCRGKPSGFLGRVQEVGWAFVLEAHLSKQQILEEYWNRAPYGARTVGVGAAGERWFGKPPAVLSPAEAALLAALPRAPSRLDPVRHPEAAKAARDEVLGRMARLGCISRGEAARALASDLCLVRRDEAFAPHFLDGVNGTLDDPAVSTARTTLAPAVQRAAEEALRRRIAALSGREVRGGAVVVLDSRTAQILALVGSADFGSSDAGQVNGALALRQPGSSVKPFTYAAAFAGSLRPSTILADVPTSYEGPSGVFAPRNYAGAFAGPVSARLALANSWNVPTVEVLRRAGAEQVANSFRAVGLPVESVARLGLGLTLGAGEVRLLDLAAAYATLARGGEWIEPSAIIEARRAGGMQVAIAPPRRHSALDPVACAWVNEILSDPASRAVAFGRGGPLEIKGAVAAKTGTSSDWRDAWAVFYSREHTVAVWMGNPDGRPTLELTGAGGPAVVAHEIIETIEAGRPSAAFDIPEGIERRAICPLSGDAAGPDCPQTDWAPYRSSDPPRPACRVHEALRIDATTGLLARSCTPVSLVRREVFADLPERFALWAADRGLRAPPRDLTCCRCGMTACAALDDEPASPRETLTLLRPLDGTVLVRDPSLPAGQQELALEASAPAEMIVSWSVDGKIVGVTRRMHRLFWAVTPGEHRIEASIAERGSRAESRVTVLQANAPG